MNKNRHYINASSLASYFGVGFLSPQEQFLVDKGDAVQEWDEDAQDRLNLGKYLENASLDFFENKFGIAIHSRNVEVVEFYDGKIRGKFDGIAELNGRPTVVENKISNSQSGRFTENKGYILQVQAYMMKDTFDQALLCGLYQGKPIYTIIEKDEEIINDIKEMADFVVDALIGVTDFEEDYPEHLYEKYTNKTRPRTVEELEEEHKAYFTQLAMLNDRKKDIENQIDALKKSIPEIDEFNDIIYEDEHMKVSIRTYENPGRFDLDTFSIEHPEIDTSKYRKPSYMVKRTKVDLKY